MVTAIGPQIELALDDARAARGIHDPVCCGRHLLPELLEANAMRIAFEIDLTDARALLQIDTE